MDIATYLFLDSARAWAFVRMCDAFGALAGFPSICLLPNRATHLPQHATVHVGIRSREERVIVDRLAANGGGEVYAYQRADDDAHVTEYLLASVIFG